MRALTPREKRVLVYFGVLCVILGWDCFRRRWTGHAPFETEHYLIESSATPEQTREIGLAAEIVYDAYAELMAQLDHAARPHPKLKMRLFKDRDEFRRCNRAVGWAEAYYSRPCCYQYYSADEVHPYHWMMHEATHQLNAEVACLVLPQWLDEGLACYLSTSRIVGDRLHLGEVDTNTYPVWWLDSFGFSGDLALDKAAGRVIPLRAILSGDGGPDLNKHFNLYYLHWWSLAHFLMQCDNGACRTGLGRLLVEGATMETFEKHIGPIEDVEARWYAHLLELCKDLAGRSTPPVRLTPAEASGSSKNAN
ncbi:MAG: hypothetical protein GX448_14115 [Planctomycetes bacterium]|nr:hypothetical protein [Planctomycetota bacterium]